MRVSNRYRLLEPLGEGGMGVVWRAYDELLDRTVAIKEVRYAGVGDERRAELNRRTIREARAAGRLDHPSVVVVHDVVEEDGRPWIVMQLVRSRSLAQVVREQGPLPVGQVAMIGGRVLDALRAAHATGVLHRDVKPENVLLADDGRVVLTDFGIASLEAEAGLTATGGLVGTPAYMPPERLNGEPARPESDLWSLGATLYAAVEGEPPFKRESWAATVAAVLRDQPEPPRRAGALAPVVMGLLHRDPAGRLPAGEAARLLHEIATAHTTPAMPFPAPSAPFPGPAGQFSDPAGQLPGPAGQFSDPAGSHPGPAGQFSGPAGQFSDRAGRLPGPPGQPPGPVGQVPHSFGQVPASSGGPHATQEPGRPHVTMPEGQPRRGRGPLAVVAAVVAALAALGALGVGGWMLYDRSASPVTSSPAAHPPATDPTAIGPTTTGPTGTDPNRDRSSRDRPSRDRSVGDPGADAVRHFLPQPDGPPSPRGLAYAHQHGGRLHHRPPQGLAGREEPRQGQRPPHRPRHPRRPDRRVDRPRHPVAGPEGPLAGPRTGDPRQGRVPRLHPHRHHRCQVPWTGGRRLGVHPDPLREPHPRRQPRLPHRRRPPVRPLLGDPRLPLGPRPSLLRRLREDLPSPVKARTPVSRDQA
ncbi:protein kinase [Nonomuraea sp. LP-02]|uniref:serine/threonine protein kinase n=1 Tax=Nonomuraea sp. LP-02 TaxID=3097960 RepID=UPI002E35F446|nr:protein kinase [Nonomuraea sp. LP-02]MED7925433.1 protein kinase [Nonomuraea sp. LP-02]